MSNPAVEYYIKRFGEDVKGAFIHLVREVGELALGMERNNQELVRNELAEIVGLSQYLAEKAGFNLTVHMEVMYRKKLESLRTSQ